MSVGTVLVLKHVPWEGPGLISKAAVRSGCEIVEFFAPHLDDTDSLESIMSKGARIAQPAWREKLAAIPVDQAKTVRTSETDPAQKSIASMSHLYGRANTPANLPSALVIMGGPMSVYETDIHPWISSELRVIEQALASGIGVLGVCLGAQMIAAAMGARVYKGESGCEIGFGTVCLTDAGQVHPALGAATKAEFESKSENSDGHRRESGVIPVFHWHCDTFDIPSGCVRLAQSNLYKNQAFGFDEKVLALQFHIEVDSDLYSQWKAHLPAPQKDGPLAQKMAGSSVDLPMLPESQDECEAALARITSVGKPLLEAYFRSI